MNDKSRDELLKLCDALDHKLREPHVTTYDLIDQITDLTHAVRSIVGSPPSEAAVGADVFEEVARELVDRIYVMFIDDQQVPDGATTEEQKIAVALRIMRPLRTAPPVPREETERIRHDFPKLMEFYAKHALGSLLPPSCLTCGQTISGVKGAEDGPAIWHTELPSVVVCRTCVDRLVAAPQEPRVVNDLAMLVGRLVRALKIANPDHELPAQAMDYLLRNGLAGSPLRAPRPPEENDGT